MPKVKVISRNDDEYVRGAKTDVHRAFHNPDPNLHHFERAVEYTRTLNSVKMDNIFARPFVGSLEGHKDGVFCLKRHPSKLSVVLSGSCDGEIKVWNLSYQKEVYSYPDAHPNGFVRGLAITPDEEHFISCGDDKMIKIWRLKDDSHIQAIQHAEDEDVDHYVREGLSLFERTGEKALTTFIGTKQFSSIDHRRDSDQFAVCAGENVEIWSHERAHPIKEYNWGLDSLTSVRFNPVETSLFASSGLDRGIVFYDIRTASSQPLKKVLLKMRSNAICWNPMQAFQIVFGNEDSRSYIFDIRNLDQAVSVHRDHVGAVLDVDFSPTGAEFVTGSYDRTIRIFPTDQASSREVYFTRRMQRIFGVLFSADSRFVVSASDDTNMRVWKAERSAAIGIRHDREIKKSNYHKRLQERFGHLPEIRRIANHRHIPKPVFFARRQAQESYQAKQVRLENRARNSAPERAAELIEHTRKKMIVAIED